MRPKFHAKEHQLYYKNEQNSPIALCYLEKSIHHRRGANTPGKVHSFKNKIYSLKLIKTEQTNCGKCSESAPLSNHGKITVITSQMRTRSMQLEFTGERLPGLSLVQTACQSLKNKRVNQGGRQSSLRDLTTKLWNYF